jgi:hypothetical protein
MGDSGVILSRDPQYRRVSAGGGGMMGRSSYWLGPDHMLLVMVEHYTESYRRFFYREIQALVIRRTTGWEWGMVLGVVGLLLTGVPALMLASGPSGGAAEAWVFGMLSGVCLLGLMVHGGRGPTCSVTLHTGVQKRQLPGVSRVRKGERLVAALVPRIEEAQGRGERSGPAPENGVEPAPVEGQERAS